MALFGLVRGRLRLRSAQLCLLYLLVLAGSLVRVREAFDHNPMNELFSDPLRHWTFARETLSDQPWAMIDPPGFQMWLSWVQKWSLGLPLLVGAYAAALSALAPWLWYRFFGELLHSRRLAVAGWALLVWLPSWIAIYRYFMTETLFLPLMGASLWQTMRSERSGRVSSFAGMVALWILTGLTRGIAVPLGGVAGVWVWARQPDKMRKLGLSVLIVLFAGVPFAIRNHHALGLWSPLGSGWPNQIYAASGAHDIHLHLTRSTGTVYYEFGSPSVYAKQLAPLSDWEPGRKGVVTVSVDLQKGSEDWQSQYESSAARGWTSLRLRWENLVLVLFGQSWPDDNRDSAVARAAQGMRWIWGPLLVLVAVAAAIRHRVTLRRPLVPGLIATWLLFQGVSLLAINEGRYRKPLEGLLIAELLLLFDGARPSSRWLATARAAAP